MPNYIVNSNAQTNGDHEVHVIPQQHNSCSYPAPANRVDLGYSATCHGAVAKARAMGYARANGCYWCANDCHTG